MSGLIIGLWRGGNQIIKQSGFEKFRGKEVVLTGKVSSDPSYDTEGDLRFVLIDTEIGGRKQSGTVWVATSGTATVKRSDEVEVSGKLTKGFGIIPAAIYRARVNQVLRKDYTDVGRDTRDWFAKGIRNSIREPEASLGSGFLLGQKTQLPEKLDQQLKLLGLTHIVVASGYNLTILVRFSRRFFSKISRYSALAMSMLLILGFAEMTGFNPSMVRASIITFLSLVAWYFGRKVHPIVLLSFSAALTVLINPSYAWGDIGWLLSFSSFVGVIILSPLIHAYFWGDKKPGNIRQVFIETMSAQLLSLPIIIFVFNQYTPISLIANALVLPFIPVAMGLVFIAGIGGIVTKFLAGLIGWPAEMGLKYMTTVIDKLSSLPQVQSEIKVGITAVIVSYLLVFTAIIFLWRRTDYQFREYNVIE